MKLRGYCELLGPIPTYKYTEYYSEYSALGYRIPVTACQPTGKVSKWQNRYQHNLNAVDLCLTRLLRLQKKISQNEGVESDEVHGSC